MAASRMVRISLETSLAMALAIASSSCVPLLCAVAGIVRGMILTAH